ncbi:MAG: pantothenate kinase [Cyanobacteriota bacterium]|nr:pantothenate kinase [Cyanobacteriota bacterium]
MNSDNNLWFGVMIGNSHLHWAKFQDSQLLETGDTKYLDFQVNPNDVAELASCRLPTLLASVVPEQTQIWQQYPHISIINLEHLPLTNLYPTLGIDRALAVLGAGTKLSFPVLVIDGGTALTLTGCDRNSRLVGGAILPGLGLQFSALAKRTAALPETDFPRQLPPRWAIETPGSIQSGVVYTLLAGIRDFIEAWCQDFPDSKIVLTGGDADLLMTYLKTHFPSIHAKIIVDHYVIFEGILAVRQKQLQSKTHIK